MESCKQLTLILSTVILILISATTGATTRPPITCHVAVFQNSQSASLVCRYNKDLRARRENYDITFCPPNSRCLDGAISCNWDGRGQALNCVTTPDFKGATCTLSGEETGDLVCQLPSVRPHHSGSYTCHLVPPDGRVQRSCAVVVPSEDKKDEERTESVHVWVLTAACIVFAVAITIIVIVLAVWMTRKRKKGEGSSSGEVKITQDQANDRSEANSGSPNTNQRNPSAVEDGRSLQAAMRSRLREGCNQESLKFLNEGQAAVIWLMPRTPSPANDVSEIDNQNSSSPKTGHEDDSNQSLLSPTP